MQVPFTKMHAFGNDFAIFDFRFNNKDVILSSNDVIILADRNFGIGCDQIITLYASETPDDDKASYVKTRIYNPDGSEATQCGNGMRCITALVLKNNTKNLIKVQIGDKTMIAKFERDRELVKVNMGVPIVTGDIVDIGNKHKIIMITNLEDIPDTEPDQELNINYVKLVSRTEVFVRTIERGVGETMSCGSGSCAAVAYCITNSLTDNIVKVNTRGSDIMSGTIEIAWDGTNKPLLQAGGYTEVFTGIVEI